MMHRILTLLCVLFLCPLAYAAPVEAPSSAIAGLPRSFADLVDKLSPAVVNISTTQKVKSGGVQMFGMPLDQMQDDPKMAPFRDFLKRFGQDGEEAGQEREVTSLGSGFIIDGSGFIITNFHVIDGAEAITATLHDNTKFKAKIIGRDKKADLALLKIDSTKPLPCVPLGDSDKMRVGDWVIAIGNPYGLGGSVTHGIISARERSINAGPFDAFLQTDAPINRGNSGGPLFNETGEVIGITTAIFSPSGGNIGIGFAIPTNMAKPIVDQLKQFGRVHRAWLGVKIEEVSDETAESLGLPKTQGALVLEASKGSPAEAAGMKSGDVILKFDGKDISEMRFLPRVVAETKIGKTVDIIVWRKGAQRTLKATLKEMDEQDSGDDEGNGEKPQKPKGNISSQALLGMNLAALTPQLRDQYNVADNTRGALVVGVTHGSEAAHREVQEGDVITEVNGEAATSPDDVKAQVAAAKKASRKFVLLKVMHGKDTAFITLPVEEKKP